MATGNDPQRGAWEIDTGWDVVTADGEKLGDVNDVHPHYLVVSKGWLFPTERYVPVSTITDVSNKTVSLAVSKSEVDSQGWDRIPDVAGMTTDATSFRDTEDVVDTTRVTGRTDSTRTTSGTNDITVPVVEEELEVRKRQVDAGTVHVHKEVVETEQQVTVPVREERIRVERHPSTGAEAAVGAHVFEEEDIEIPLRGEAVEVTTRPVVREHVRISKDVVEHEEQASGTVRREEVIVEGEDAIDRSDRP